MGADSKIEWTDHSFNPWWGCTRVSPGCEHCYAEAFDHRLGRADWGVKAERRFFGEKHWREPLKWDAEAARAGERRRVFCASMADVFEDREDLAAERAKVFSLITFTPHLDWLLLTKRPENMERLAPAAWVHGWPTNVWAGCTVEDQKRADERIPHLLRVPAAVRFLSCEPLLGPVRLDHLDVDRAGDPDWCQVDALTGRHTDMGRPCKDVPSVHWVIVGGRAATARDPCTRSGYVRCVTSASVPASHSISSSGDNGERSITTATILPATATASAI